LWGAGMAKRIDGVDDLACLRSLFCLSPSGVLAIRVETRCKGSWQERGATVRRKEIGL